MKMYAIKQADEPQGFFDAWKTAGLHLASQVQDKLNWIRATPYRPMIEHLSFRLGNQIFWVFIEMFNGDECVLPFAGNARKLFLDKSKEANVTPCTMRMQNLMATLRWAVGSAARHIR